MVAPWTIYKDPTILYIVASSTFSSTNSRREQFNKKFVHIKYLTSTNQDKKEEVIAFDITRYKVRRYEIVV